MSHAIIQIRRGNPGEKCQLCDAPHVEPREHGLYVIGSKVSAPAVCTRCAEKYDPILAALYRRFYGKAVEGVKGKLQ